METKKVTRIFCTESDRKSFDLKRYPPIDLQATYICKQCNCKEKVADKFTHDKAHIQSLKVEAIGLQRLSDLFASKSLP